MKKAKIIIIKEKKKMPKMIGVGKSGVHRDDTDEDVKRKTKEVLLANAPKKFEKISLDKQIVLIEKRMIGDGKDLTFQRNVFAVWYALPATKRKPRTTPALANKFGIKVDTLYKWLDRPEIVEAIRIARKQYFRQQTTKILGYLQKRCKKFGRAQDIKLWLEYMEDWIPKQEQVQDQTINVIFKGIKRPQIAEDGEVIDGKLPELTPESAVNEQSKEDKGHI